MKRFNNILVVQDGAIGSEAALDHAETLAKAHGASLTVAEVLRDYPANAALNLLAEREATLRSRYREERRARLDRLAAPARQAGIEVDTALFEGVPHVEIDRAVARDGYDLVIITEGLRSLRTMAFGTTAAQLVRGCPCPVWVVKPQPPRGVCRVVAAVKGVEEPAAMGLDREVLAIAASLARGEGCQLDVFSAWEFERRDLEASRTECPPGELEQLHRHQGKAHEQAVRALAAAVDMGGLNWRLDLHKGDAESGLTSFAEENAADLIVIGASGRRGLAGRLVGGRAERLLARCGCSLVGVKPPAFEIPYELADPRDARRVAELSAAS